jgi:hypothetical protein
MVKLLGSGLQLVLRFCGSLGLMEMTSKVADWVGAGVCGFEAACSCAPAAALSKTSGRRSVLVNLALEELSQHIGNGMERV